MERETIVQDLKFVNDPSGKPHHAEWVEGLTMTRKGGLSKYDRRLPQRVFAVPERLSDRCPLQFLRLLLSKRPADLQSCGPLYLRPLKTPKQDVWFSSQPVGENNLDTYMQQMATLAGLDTTNKRFTNHSARKTTIMKLQKAGVSNDKIVSITGHKNEQSLHDYIDVDMEDHAKLSEILIGAHTSRKRPLKDTTNIDTYVGTSAAQSGPGPSTFNFTNCTVFFGNSCNTSSNTQLNQIWPQHSELKVPPRKRAYVIDSDSDQDM